MKTLRISYSMACAWARGDYSRAVDMLMRVDTPPTEAMRQGKVFHEKWEEESRKTLCLPEIFGSRQLVQPKFEIKYEKPLAEWLTLVGVLDVEEPTVGTDYKTGVSSAAAYANSHQHGIYQILRPGLERFEYHAFNQYTKEVTFAAVYLTDQTLDGTVTWLLKQAYGIREYMEAAGITQVLKEQGVAHAPSA